MSKWKKMSLKRKVFVTFTILSLLTVVGWAAKELSGQANSASQEAGVNSVDYEIAALDATESTAAEENKPEPPPCNWQQLKALDNQIEANNAEYQTVVASAQAQLDSTGVLEDGTRERVHTLSKQYAAAQEEAADLWEDCNAKTRAKMRRELAATRLASADVVLAEEIDNKKLKALEKQQNSLAKAHTDYANSVDSDAVSSEDKARLNNQVLPSIDTKLAKFGAFVTNVTALIQEVQETADAVSNAGRNPLRAVQSLRNSGGMVRDLKTLLSVARGSEKNMKTVRSNAEKLPS